MSCELGIPSMAMPAPAGLGCQKDLAACPVGWRAKGVLCYAGEDYSGKQFLLVHFVRAGGCGFLGRPVRVYI